MLIVLSPAKRLDFDAPSHVARHSQPAHLGQARRLMARLKPLDVAQVASLMSISDALAALNVARNARWKPPFTTDNAKQALLAFDGDVYDGLDARSLDASQLDWAQDHLRILSGLYGILRPLDLMQPYRLEMGTRLANERGRDLYAFWGARLADSIGAELASHACPVLVNLASEEYSRAVVPGALGHPVVQPVFQEWRDGRWKVISFAAKRARGRMARFAIERRIDDPSQLEAFDLDGYRFEPAASTTSVRVFRRGP